MAQLEQRQSEATKYLYERLVELWDNQMMPSCMDIYVDRVLSRDTVAIIVANVSDLDPDRNWSFEHGSSEAEYLGRDSDDYITITTTPIAN